MGILGFGRAKKLEDLNVKGLKKERLVQEVQQDQLVTRIRRAQDEYDGLLDAASEPGLSDAEIDVAAYKMDLAAKRKDKTEAELQRVITRMTVLDSTVDVIERKTELERRGIWKRINEMAEDDLEQQLEAIAIERKESDLTLDKIVEMFEVDAQAVRSSRSAGFRRSRDTILQARETKHGPS